MLEVEPEDSLFLFLGGLIDVNETGDVKRLANTIREEAINVILPESTDVATVETAAWSNNNDK